MNLLQVQTGNLNQPQIISFDSLFTTYSIKNAFNHEEKIQMEPILSKWKNLVTNHFSNENDRPLIASYMTSSPGFNLRYTRRTAHVEFKETPNVIYKTYYTTSGLHPMATTLRAPMQTLIQDTIFLNDLNMIETPRKGLYPLFSKDVIEGLDENSINEAFIVCAEKIKAFNPKETREIIKNWSYESQKVLANQCCTILTNTGLGDFTWENLQMHRYNGKLYALDTETLYYELFIDKFGKGFEKCTKAVNSSTLSKCAKNGLEWFKMSSDLHNFEIFADTASSYLEKID